ncbi:hypothetical protein Tco_0837037 [Tanacetum coccineum]
MSSPNHPTFDIEDAFSSNFSDYIPASPDYFPASSGNTSSESSNNSSGLVPIASPTLSLFHNDPYMKVPIPVTATETGPSIGLKMVVPSTAEEKICKKNDIKARSLLLMALPNEHQLTFDQYVDAQSMFASIKAFD